MRIRCEFLSLSCVYVCVCVFVHLQRTMGKSLDVRDEALLEKEKELAVLRTENTTLENFRFVLDHKLGKVVEERGVCV